MRSGATGICRSSALTAAACGAAGDFTRARETLALHRRKSTKAYDDLNDGLSILTDCMQHPSAQNRTRAQRFYDEQTQSMARRRIRRECLEAVR